MVITDIRKNLNNPNRYSIFIDDKYAFSLSDAKLIESKIAAGDKIDKNRVEELKATSSSDKLYGQALKYVSARLKTKWEVKRYLEKKEASPALISDILNKLTNMNLVNDEEYIKAYIRDRQATRPASKIKIEYELQKKHIDRDLIKRGIGEVEYNDLPALRELIAKKRSYYKDETKLIGYLARQGFSYGDIKKALENSD